MADEKKETTGTTEAAPKKKNWKAKLNKSNKRFQRRLDFSLFFFGGVPCISILKI